MVSFVAFVVLLLNIVGNVCNGGITSSFVRKVEKSEDMPLDSDVFRVPPGYNAPQQVHLTQGDYEGKGVIVSWVTTSEPGSNTVRYWKANNPKRLKAVGNLTTYKYYNYTSGYIHHCTLDNLEYNTTYYYMVGFGHSHYTNKSFTNRTFWFTTPPRLGPDVPYTFGLIGDLGQTYDSNHTLTHYQNNPTKAQTLLFVGDLSYADHYPDHNNIRWDTWGRFVERVNAYQPWIWTAGNHEIDFAPEIVSKYTPQYIWLVTELAKNVNRNETPWLIVLMHAPMYNSYNSSFHYMEGETMRVVYEPFFVKYKVDLVFTGHVHAYERSKRVSNTAYNITNKKCTPVSNNSAPVHIIIGDGGNIEGLATGMTEPQPSYSAFREASFGHGILDIKNRTHAFFSWHRNQDDYPVTADSMWFHNRYFHPVDDLVASE